ncbi:glutaminase [Arthrobacter pigmenti]|uniref:Glutaminase n=1 Tax=Arthrobacter pigmenti TaxID=271432 RepID=A0A846RM56_9MICC|nr:glutaminase [Arthrobacter pigmenti]NJC24488.1 glutaminase [Arthrobacter pigmenti]
MRSPVPDYLSEVLHTCFGDTSGHTAGYIPELAAADPDLFGLALSTVDGSVYCAGDAGVEFTIQSISKPFIYALAIKEHGLESVLQKVGVEPSGEAFNELSLERESKRPLNPMINAGAITAHTLIAGQGDDGARRDAVILDGLSAFAGRSLTVNESVLGSEMGTAHRNLAIAHMLRSHGIIDQEPAEVVRGYTRQCSINVTARDLALMAATLANGGVQPLTGEQVLTAGVVRQVLAVMTTCGMYDAAGDWVTTVGIPAKSGVAGGIIGALPGQVGLAAFSPRLDHHGNSVRGIKACERLSQDMGLHLMEVPQPARAVIRQARRIETDGGARFSLYELQGSIQFAAAERIIRTLAEEPDHETGVVFDLSRVHQLNDVGRRMLLEAISRLTLDGHQVTLIDPETVLNYPDAGGGTHPDVVTTLEDLTNRRP